MSLIYEALEKVEQEKKGVVKNFVKSNLHKKNTQTLYKIAGVLIFLFFLGLVYLLVNSHKALERRDNPIISPSRGSTSSPFSLPISRSRFSLTGITRVGNDWTAIINNQLVRVGDWVGEARIKAIQEQEVILDHKGQILRLSLYGEGPAHLMRSEVAK